MADKKTPPPPGQQPLSDQIRKAHEEADRDIEKDPDLSVSSPNDDLDEGESARLGEDETPVE